MALTYGVDGIIVSNHGEQLAESGSPFAPVCTHIMCNNWRVTVMLTCMCLVAGGRQLDYSPSALDMLPAIVAAVQGRVPVWMDGGIRRGTDVFKVRVLCCTETQVVAPPCTQPLAAVMFLQALALGASAVLLGRPVLYGLAVGGAAGVQLVLDMLRREFELAMALTGCTKLQDIGPHLLLQRQSSGLVSVTQPQQLGSSSGSTPARSKL